MPATYYFAVFCPNANGSYTIWFPDVPEAITQGGNLAEGMDMAADVLSISLEEYAKARKPLPTPSPLAEIQAMAATTIQELELTPDGEIAYPLIAAPNFDTTPVKLGISMPKNVLEMIDQKARRHGTTRSGFLAEAALAYGG